MFDKKEKQEDKPKIRRYVVEGPTLIDEFKTLSEAAKFTNIKRVEIYKCCRYEILEAGGYIWRFSDDDDDISEGIFAT